MLPPKPFDPLSDPLQVENLCNEALHALRTCGSHVICEVTIDVQGERRCGMAEIALHGFDVISSADAVDSVGVAKVMYPCVGDADALYHTFEAVEDRTVGNIAPKLISKHQTTILPCRAGK